MVDFLFQPIFTGKVYCEACCGGMKKLDAMYFVSIPAILSTIVLIA